VLATCLQWVSASSTSHLCWNLYLHRQYSHDARVGAEGMWAGQTALCRQYWRPAGRCTSIHAGASSPQHVLDGCHIRLCNLSCWLQGYNAAASGGGSSNRGSGARSSALWWDAGPSRHGDPVLEQAQVLQARRQAGRRSAGTRIRLLPLSKSKKPANQLHGCSKLFPAGR
jgi:hypothetical protein